MDCSSDWKAEKCQLRNRLERGLIAQEDSEQGQGLLLTAYADPVMSNYTIDHIVEPDFEVWAALWRKYLEFYNTSLPEAQYHKTFARLTAASSGGRVAQDPAKLYGLLLRDEEGTVQGLAHFLYHGSSWTDLPHCYLNDLFVNPTSRKSGYGKALIKKVQEHAKIDGKAARLYWTTAPDNLTARRLYDSIASTNRVAYRIDL